MRIGADEQEQVAHRADFFGAIDCIAEQRPGEVPRPVALEGNDLTECSLPLA
ncbi:MAG: hypothetical protein ACRYGI_14150 [Janthinobacterium lividum]